MGLKTGLLDGVLGKYVEIKNEPGGERTERLICRVCRFTVTRSEVRIRGTRHPGYSNKYWGMKSKMVAHFHRDHPDIWATVERE